ncbi:MAG TPA: hypothetical protein VMG38_07805 [Trebonia sp.]|nr:hypothetical protein [Trebonia sp.]
MITLQTGAVNTRSAASTPSATLAAMQWQSHLETTTPDTSGVRLPRS